MSDQPKQQQLGLITNVVYGYNGNNGVGMMFSVRILNGDSVLFMNKDRVTKLLIEHKIPNISNLRGQPCVVNVDENNTIFFEDLIKI